MRMNVVFKGFLLEMLAKKPIVTPKRFFLDRPIFVFHRKKLGGGFKYFWNFHPEPWGNDPI